jgi:uncharacterized protein
MTSSSRRRGCTTLVYSWDIAPKTRQSWLRDADILEQLGGIGILRTVCKVGRDTRYATFTDAIETLRKNLQTLPGEIHLENTKRLAEPRIAALKSFLEAVDAEANGSLF